MCVSTQAGCKFGCKFCASGEESKQHKKRLSHVVFMGVGEPLDTVKYDRY